MIKYLALPVLLASCAISPQGVGNAQYKYEKTPDSCSVTVNSIRALQGLNLSIDDKCAVAVKADKANTDQAYTQMMGQLIKLIPPVIPGVK